MGLRSVSSAISVCSSISIIDINGNIIIFFLSSSEPSLCGVKQLISFKHEDCESNH